MEAWIAPPGAGAAGSGAGVGACPLLDALSGKRLGGAKLLAVLLKLLPCINLTSNFKTSLIISHSNTNNSVTG